MVLAEWIREAENVVIFSGAGMSTESGLRDFRSFDRGMWNDRDPMELASTTAMEKNRDEFIRFYQWRIQEMLKHQPNQGHRILAKWEDAGIVKGIITQNVENYHEQAGTKNIAKLHGDLGTLRCMVCGRRYACEESAASVAHSLRLRRFHQTEYRPVRGDAAPGGLGAGGTAAAEGGSVPRAGIIADRKSCESVPSACETARGTPRHRES